MWVLYINFPFFLFVWGFLQEGLPDQQDQYFYISYHTEWNVSSFCRNQYSRLVLGIGLDWRITLGIIAGVLAEVHAGRISSLLIRVPQYHASGNTTFVFQKHVVCSNIEICFSEK